MKPSPATCRYCFKTIIYSAVPADQAAIYSYTADLENPYSYGGRYCQNPNGDHVTKVSGLRYGPHDPMDPFLQMAFDSTKPGI